MQKVVCPHCDHVHEEPACLKSWAGYPCSNCKKGFWWEPGRPPTKYAPDVASASSAEPDTGLESVSAVESDTQPRG